MSTVQVARASLIALALLSSTSALGANSRPQPIPIVDTIPGNSQRDNARKDHYSPVISVEPCSIPHQARFRTDPGDAFCLTSSIYS